MKPMRTFLAPTDFSDAAQLAVERAAQLAAAHEGARLILMHVTSPPGVEVVLRMMGQTGSEVEARLAVAARQRLVDLAEQ